MNSAASEPSPSRLSLFHVALLVPWIAVVVNSLAVINDNSYLWHIRAGDLQIQAGEVMTSDIFSFTVFGEAWRTQSWLAELGYGWLETLSGLGFTAPMVLVFSVLAFVSVGAIAHRHSASVAITAIVLLLTAVIVPRFIVPRPVLFSYLLFPLVILAWERAGARWTTPFLFWIWASVHGGFVIGLLYIGLRTMQNRDWKGLRVGLVSGAACLATAHGLGVIEMLVDFARAREYLAFIMEWQIPNLLEPTLLPMVLGVLLIVYGATQGRMEAADIWVVGPFLLLALSSQRSVGMAWLGLLPLISSALGPLRFEWVRGMNRPAVITFAVIVLALPFAFTEPAVIDEEVFPVEAAGHLSAVNTFHDDGTGGYLIWAMGPRFPVYIDDRVELYGERIEEFFNVRTRQEDWREVFSRDGIQQALLSVEEPLVEELTREGWTVQFEDEDFIVLSSR